MNHKSGRAFAHTFNTTSLSNASPVADVFRCLVIIVAVESLNVEFVALLWVFDGITKLSLSFKFRVSGFEFGVFSCQFSVFGWQCRV
jgi:hypothetical protein